MKVRVRHCGPHCGDDELVTNVHHADDFMLYAEPGRPTKRWDDQINFFRRKFSIHHGFRRPTTKLGEMGFSWEKLFYRGACNVNVWL